MGKHKRDEREMLRESQTTGQTDLELPHSIRQFGAIYGWNGLPTCTYLFQVIGT